MKNQTNRKKAPGISKIQKIDYQIPEQINLDNGIKTFVFDSVGNEIVQLSFIFDAGIVFSNKQLLSVFANSLFKEAPVGKSAEKIAEFFDYYACMINGFIANKTAGIKIIIPSIHAKKVIPVLADLIKNPAMPEREYKTLVKTNYEKIKLSLQKTKYLALKGLNNQMFGDNSPFGAFTKPEDANNLSLKEIKDFVFNHYNSKSCRIIIAGDYNHRIAKLINDNFGQQDWGNKYQQKYKSNIIKSKERYNYTRKDDAMQSSIFLGKHINLKNKEDIHYISVLNTILGGYFGSRLMKNIREDKAYTYGIGSFITVFPDNPVLRITTDVGTEFTNATVKEIFKEINKLRTKPVGIRELETVKSYMIGDILSSLNGSFQTANVFEKHIESGFDFKYMDKEIKVINAISLKNIQDIANEYINPDEFYTSIAGLNNFNR